MGFKISTCSKHEQTPTLGVLECVRRGPGTDANSTKSAGNRQQRKRQQEPAAFKMATGSSEIVLSVHKFERPSFSEKTNDPDYVDVGRNTLTLNLGPYFVQCVLESFYRTPFGSLQEIMENIDFLKLSPYIYSYRYFTSR